MPKPTAVLSPNLGLYFDRPPLTVPLRGLQDGQNFRIRDGSLNNLNLGWARFSDFTLDGPVRLIHNFLGRVTGRKLVMATNTDIYEYDTVGDDALYLTPRYSTGTADVSSADPAVVDFSAPYGANIRVGDKISFGTADERDITATWYEVASLDDADSVTLTTAVAGAPLAGTDFTVRNIFTMDDDDWWDQTEFIGTGTDDDYLIMTNGVDFPVSWNGTDDEVTVQDGMNFKCRAVATYNNMVIYGNLQYAGGTLSNQIINSDPTAGPFAAGDDGTGLSDQFRVHEGADGIIALRILGDDLIAYSERHVTHISFLGEDVVFAFRQSIVGKGPIGHNAVADFNDVHQFLGPDSLYLYDGVSSREEDIHVWREVLREQDPVRKFMARCHFVEELGELIWSIALVTDAGNGDAASPPQEAFTAHYLEPVGDRTPTPYSHRDFPFTALGYFERQSTLTWADLVDTWADYNFRWNDQFFSAAFPQSLGGTADGEVYVLNESQTADGTPLESFVVFGRRPIGDGRMRGLVRRIYPFCDLRSNPMDVTLRLMDHANGPPTITQTDSFDQSLPEGGHFVSPFRRGRFAEVQFGSDTEGWALSGYDWDLTPGGLR